MDNHIISYQYGALKCSEYNNCKKQTEENSGGERDGHESGAHKKNNAVVSTGNSTLQKQL
jgi:hypothetical protein